MPNKNQVFASKEFVRFIMVGGFAALINFISRIYYSLLMNFSYAIIAAHVTGMVTAFILNKILVFGPGKHHTLKQFAYFTLVNLIAVAQTWTVSLLLFQYGLDWLDFSDVSWLSKAELNHDLTRYKQEVAHFAGISVTVFSSYIGHKHLTFKR